MPDAEMFHFRPGAVFAVLCGGFIAGIAVESFALPWWVASFGFCFVSVFSFLTKKVSYQARDFFGFVLVFFIASFVGAWRYVEVQPTMWSVAMVADGEKREIEGTIVRISESESNLKLTLAQVSIGGEIRENRVLVKTSLFADVAVGERASVLCSLERPEAFEDFAYDRYLAAKDILATCTSPGLPFVLGEDERWRVKMLAKIDRLHEFIVQQIDVVLPDPHAQLLAGLLIGDDAFSQTWKEWFLRTGTSHIVAASGSNVALTVSLILTVFFSAGIRRRSATIFVLFGIAMFVLLAGGESAVLRAGIMATLVVIARVTGRASSVRNVMLCTVCVMLWFEPRILRDDVGFQLSVLSTMGLVWWSKALSDRLSFLPEKFGIREGFATTLAATFATLPVTVFGMGQVSLVGPIANLLVLPLLPFAMATGAFAVVVGMILPMAGRFVAFPAWWILDTVLMVLRELSALPFVYIEVKSWVLDVLLSFGGIVAGVVRYVSRFVRIRKDPDMRRDLALRVLPFVLFGSLFITSFAQHVTRDGWFSSDVRVWVFDVGQGDGIFIDTSGKDVVIDGGPSLVMREKIGTVFPWFDRQVDYVFLTHPHADHLVGLVPIFENYSVDFFGESEQGCTSVECRVLYDVVFESRSVSAGDIFVLAPDVTLRAIWPEAPYRHQKLSDPNDGSLVFLLETAHSSMLFTGDAGVAQEEQFLSLLPDSIDVLKIGHHGSRTSTSDMLLSVITPSIGVISLGEENLFGHPHNEVVDRLSEHGTETYRTDVFGDIRVEFGKGGVRVDTFRL